MFCPEATGARVGVRFALVFGCVILAASAASVRAQPQPPSSDEVKSPSAPAPVPAATRASESSARPAARSINAAVPARQSSWIGAGIALGVLNLPKVGVGAQVLGQLRLTEGWSLELGASYWFENNADLAVADLDLMVHPLLLVPYPDGGSRLTVSGAQFRAAVCPLERGMGSDSLVVCGGVEAGFVRVVPKGFVGMQSQTAPTLDLELFARYHFRLGAGFGISYSAGLFVAFLRDRYGYRDRSNTFREAYQRAPVGGRLDLAVTYRL